MSNRSIEAIRDKIKNIPRIMLGDYPTALRRLNRVVPRTAGYQLYLKRDDALGGNKVRKLEFFMAEAMDMGADTVITFGALQSNHSRETAIACRRLGLKPVIVVSGQKKGDLQGNALLNHILGARMVYIEPLKPAPFTPGGPQTVGQMSEALKKCIPQNLLGPKTYVIPVGGYTPLGSLGYIEGFLELYQQCCQRKIKIDYVVTAVGTSGTLCGLAAGAALVNKVEGQRVKVLGISVTGDQSPMIEDVAKRAVQTAALIGEDIDINLEDLIISDDYWAPAYGEPNTPGLDAIEMLAKKEGIFLDPVYTGKAMAGLLDMIGKEKLKLESNIVFIHTGGFPSLFAYQEYFNNL